MDRHYRDWQRLARISHRLVTIHSQVPLPEEEGAFLPTLTRPSATLSQRERDAEKCGRG